MSTVSEHLKVKYEEASEQRLWLILWRIAKMVREARKVKEAARG
jgi:hypothetical protein